MSRFPRPFIQDGIYYLTCVTYLHRRWFSNPTFAQIVIDQWKQYAQAYQFTLNTYCVMPNHYHVLLQVGKKKTVSQILHAVNSYTATLLNHELGYKNKIKIWKGNPWDSVIVDEDMYWTRVKYSLLNPWQAGLVCDPLDHYPFSDIADWRARMGDEFLLDLFGF
jgi:REP element-mobilizing transposase RayT